MDGFAVGNMDGTSLGGNDGIWVGGNVGFVLGFSVGVLAVYMGIICVNYILPKMNKASKKK